jgi:hypothetical protein
MKHSNLISIIIVLTTIILNYNLVGAEVVVDIKANGSDGPITVSATDTVSITVRLDPGDHTGQNADWWLVTSQSPPFVWYSYVYPLGLREGIRVSLQNPLFELSPSLEVLNMNLPAGRHTFCFAVDENADGIPDATWLDFVDVEVLSSNKLSAGLKIFVTSEDHVGDFEGDPTLTGSNAIEKADSFCNRDPNKPNDGAYKALLVDGSLRDAKTLTDWVLQPNTTYYRPYNDIEIGTTINSGIFTAFYSDLANSIDDSGLAVWLPVWTGIGDASDFTAGESCSNWSSGNGGTGASGDSSFVDGWAFFNGWGACGNHYHLYCVEQP